ncbi:MAG TPA: ATP-dependent helicase [Acidimicrobiales bacterium]|nr:ATP-dependent helicase [Acidimicrobiales bacterium]
MDDAQLAAATHGDGPLVILAGAGTGKTRTLTARVACLLHRGVPAERILLLTFTRRAADDMLARATALAGTDQYLPDQDALPLGRGTVRGGTFHAVAHWFLRSRPHAFGLMDGFSVIDPADTADAMDILRGDCGLSAVSGRERLPSPSTLAEIYSRCVNTQSRLSEVLLANYPWCEPHLDAIGLLFKAYTAIKRRHNQLDFDDLLLYWRAALTDDLSGARLSELFDHVLVDEFQDVNSLQADIVRGLRPDGLGLTVVGDHAQAIYGFRGADASHLLGWPTELPGVRVVRLESNFRSMQPILDVANATRTVLESPAGRLRLTLKAIRRGGCCPTLVSCYDASVEARAVVDRVLERREEGRRLQDQAVLVRAAHHSDLIEVELATRHVPYRKYGGLRFLEAAHVKDFLAAARLVSNPADGLGWFRLLKLHQGIGPSAARALVARLPPVTAHAPLDARAALATTLEKLAEARGAPGAGRQAELVFDRIRPLVAARYRTPTARIGDLERLMAAAWAAEAAGRSLASWVTELSLDPPVAAGDLAGPPSLDEDFLVISTVHSAKGLEWAVVHLPHLVDGAFPSDMALNSADGLDEERRLFYVAVTRACDELLLYTPLRMPQHRFAHDDRHCLAPRSRFLDHTVLGLVRREEVAPYSPVPAGLATGPASAASVSLDHLWS